MSNFNSNILSQDAFWMVNKAISLQVGVEASLLLSELIGRASYMENIIQIDGDDYFQATVESLENATSLSYKIQRKCISILKKNNLINTKLRGIPAKQHLTIRHIEIEQIIRTSSAKREELLYKNTKYKNSYKSNTQQSDLFGKTIKGLHDFKNSPYYDKEVFKKKLSEAANAGIDVENYWHALNDYSESKGKKYKDWAAAARSFMRSDKQKGQLKMLNSSSNEISLEFFKI